jgi:superoxide dismutase, Cu-Zn family
MKDTLIKLGISMVFISTANIALAAADHPSKAIAVLVPTQGNQISGTVAFTQTSKGIEIVADITGLAPGKHGFHIHEYGDCSASDGVSAGGHFNPKQMHHAGTEDAHRHVGDLGNIEADANGKAHYTYLDKLTSLKGSSNIIGRSVIVHANEDDLKTQPAGNSGGRIACGVIGIAAP